MEKKNNGFGRIPMVDLQAQYLDIKSEVGQDVMDTIESCWFIKGPKVASFEKSLADYLNCKHVIGVANGTDALQIALMALGLQPGDEVILPSFTYVATAEVIALLGLVPRMIDVDGRNFNIDVSKIEEKINDKTKAIVPVHLFGQSADMTSIMTLADKYGLFVVEDNAQAIGCRHQNEDGSESKTGTIGHIGCTSFYPSKNLGCYGDGGAINTNDETLAEKIRMIACHGENKKYHHKLVGVNSRLDAIQAGILNIKLMHLEKYHTARQSLADFYDQKLAGIAGLQIPERVPFSNHVFHQYTLIVKDGKRASLQEYLTKHGISNMIYYPIPLYRQEAYSSYWDGEEHPNTEYLCDSVLSIPMHSHMKNEMAEFITERLIDFFK